jgi:hypothetical protein
MPLSRPQSAAHRILILRYKDSDLSRSSSCGVKSAGRPCRVRVSSESGEGQGARLASVGAALGRPKVKTSLLIDVLEYDWNTMVLSLVVL